uniref:Cathepsin propeptide inhibitor domain-containing protein n=1 Tax=Panagrellus redivivus TaxID=6233 RepID=A0A7E4VWC3_PANRE
MSRFSLHIQALCAIYVIMIVSSTIALPIENGLEQPDHPKFEQKRFYSWEEGKRSADDYDRSVQHEMLKRKLYQMNGDLWATNFRL